jgi:hypothetical protein
MKSRDILNNTDPQELRNIIYRLARKQAQVQTPPLTEVVNESPEQFPPASSETGNDLGWFNVKDYGAFGDGVTDDTTYISSAIDALTAAGGGVLYFPPGQYLTSGGFTISVNAMILGMGMGDFHGDDGVTEILCNSATATLFTVSTDRATFRDLALRNTAGSTPSAGAGISVSSANLAQKVDYENISVYGFYVNVDVQVGTEWHMEGSYILAPVLYGLKIQNTVNPDAGDWSINNSSFIAKLYDSSAGIRIESSGGGKIVNTKINGNAPSDNKRFTHGIDLVGSNNTSIFLLSNLSIENINTNGIHVSGLWNYIQISNVQIGLYTSNNTSAISIDGTNYFHIVDSQLIYTVPGSSSAAAIALSNCTFGYIAGITQRNFASKVSKTSCTDIIEADPASSVVTETAYGQASAVGTSTYWARQDHTHGTPALSTANPADVGSAAAPGSGSTPSKNDHVHRGVTSVNGQYGDVSVAAAGQVSAIARWISSGGTTFDLPDVAESIQNVFNAGSLTDPTLYSLSSDRTQIVFDSAVTAANVVVADYVVAQVG